MCFCFETPNLVDLRLRGFLFVVDSSRITDQFEIFKAYGLGLNAPNGYFGTNWNAFLDCFGYLDWIKKPDVFIVHQDLPKLSRMDMEIYLDILRTAVLRLSVEDIEEFQLAYPELIAHRLTVYFPKALESTLYSLLGNEASHSSSSI